MVTEERRVSRSAKRERADRPVATMDHIRIEVVDNWHKDWESVLDSIKRNGQLAALMLDRDGWVIARQSVLAAFVGQRVVGHLFFHVEPTKSQGRDGRAELEARLDSLSVDEKASGDVNGLLLQAAEAHSRVVRCRTFRRDC